MIVLPPPLVNQAQPDVRVSAAPLRPAGSAPVAADTAATSDPEPTPDELRQVVSRINLALQQTRNNLEFSIDTDANQTVVKLVDTSTGQLIRQFPSAATLELSRSIELSPQGLLVKREA
ncbi:MAG: flagellar protein FlaG [Pseudomonadota bacterium]